MSGEDLPDPSDARLRLLAAAQPSPEVLRLIGEGQRDLARILSDPGMQRLLQESEGLRRQMAAALGPDLIAHITRTAASPLAGATPEEWALPAIAIPPGMRARSNLWEPLPPAGPTAVFDHLPAGAAAPVDERPPGFRDRAWREDWREKAREANRERVHGRTAWTTLADLATTTPKTLRKWVKAYRKDPDPDDAAVRLPIDYR